jgi:putative transposase
MVGHLRRELVLDALNMTIGQRRPTQVIHHSDQVCQFGLRCRDLGIRPSMGSAGDAYDALCESFFASLECELLDAAASPPRPRPASPSSSTSKLVPPHRHHSALDYESPQQR